MSRTALVALIVLGLTASLACSLGGALTPDTGADVEPEAVSEEGGEAGPSDEQAEPQPSGDETAPAGAGREGLKLIFIHHSSGENWLSDENGGLGPALMEHGYFVSDTNYDWGPSISDLGGPVGSFTDTGHWWTWFQGPESEAVLKAVFSESEQHASYTRLEQDPGGENQIILFKSCFPNSALDGSPDDTPTGADNPLRGLDAGSGFHTVANAKGIYVGLLEVFASHPDKLFVAVTAPPLHADETTAEQAANARAFNRWLVEEWLADYPLPNVAVFDFYNVLTSNGGSPDENDAGASGGNHHRLVDGDVEYIYDQGSDTSAYAYPGDSHPTPAGNQKATEEFVPLLDWYVQQWLGK
jgi:hypothetical protein